MPVMGGSSVPAGRDPAREAASAVVQNILAARQTNAAQMGARASMMKAKTAESLAPFQQAATVVGGLTEAINTGTNLWSTYHKVNATKQATEAARLQNEYNAATIQSRVLDARMKVVGQALKLAEFGVPIDDIMTNMKGELDGMVREADMNMNMSARRDARGRRSATYSMVRNALRGKQVGQGSFRGTATEILNKDGSFRVFNDRFFNDLTSTLGKEWNAGLPQGQEHPDFIRFKQNFNAHLKKGRMAGQHLDDTYEYYKEQVPSGLKDVLWPEDPQDWHKNTGQWFDDAVERTLDGMGLDIKSLQGGDVFGMPTGGAGRGRGSGSGGGTGVDPRVQASFERRAQDMQGALTEVEKAQERGEINSTLHAELGGGSNVAHDIGEQTRAGQGRTEGSNVNERTLENVNIVAANSLAKDTSPYGPQGEHEIGIRTRPITDKAYQTWGHNGWAGVKTIGANLFAQLSDMKPESKDSIYATFGSLVDQGIWGSVDIKDIGSLQQGKVGVPIDDHTNKMARQRNAIVVDLANKYMFIKGAAKLSSGRMVAKNFAGVLKDHYGPAKVDQIINTLQGTRNTLTRGEALPRNEHESEQLRALDDLIAGMQGLSEDQHDYRNASGSTKYARDVLREYLQGKYEIEGRGAGELKTEYIRIPETLITYEVLDAAGNLDQNYDNNELRTYELEDVVNALWSGSEERPVSWEELVFGDQARTHSINVVPQTGLAQKIGTAYLAKEPTENQKELIAMAKEVGIEKPSGTTYVDMATGEGSVKEAWVNQFGAGGDHQAKMLSLQQRVIESGIQKGVQKKMSNKLKPQDRYSIEARELADKARISSYSDTTAPAGKNPAGVSPLYKEVVVAREKLDLGGGTRPERMAQWLNILTHLTSMGDTELHDKTAKEMINDTNHKNDEAKYGEGEEVTGMPLGVPANYHNYEIVQKAAQKYAFTVAGRLRNEDQPHYNKFGAGRVTKGYGERQMAQMMSTGDPYDMFKDVSSEVKARTGRNDSAWIKKKNEWLSKRFDVLGGKGKMSMVADLLGHHRPVSRNTNLRGIYLQLQKEYRHAFHRDITPAEIDELVRSKMGRMGGVVADELSMRDALGLESGPKYKESFNRYIQDRVTGEEGRTATYDYGVLGEEDPAGRITTIFDFEEELGPAGLTPYYPTPPKAESATGPSHVEEDGVFYEEVDDSKGWNTPGYHGVPRDIYGKRIPLPLPEEYAPWMDPDKPGPGESLTARIWPGIFEGHGPTESEAPTVLPVPAPVGAAAGQPAAPPGFGGPGSSFQFIEELLDDEPINAPLAGTGSLPPVGPKPSIDIEKLMKDLGLAGMPNFQTGDSAYDALTQGMGIPSVQSTPNLAPDGPSLGILSDILERLTEEENYPPNLDPAILEQLLNAPGNNPN